MKQDKSLQKKRISLASLALIFGVAGYLRFQLVSCMFLGILTAVICMRMHNFG
ncbi:hypothetical protein [[Eubacterium] hominis]|jgi:hypothetical protein|uniref:hypothetical protein n=1 Tax=[Eubacterium] hominis TaxID=2764325 RepID=UPI0015BB8F42